MLSSFPEGRRTFSVSSSLMSGCWIGVSRSSPPFSVPFSTLSTSVVSVVVLTELPVIS